MTFGRLRELNDGGTQRADFHVLAVIDAGPGPVAVDFHATRSKTGPRCGFRPARCTGGMKSPMWQGISCCSCRQRRSPTRPENWPPPLTRPRTGASPTPTGPSSTRRAAISSSKHPPRPVTPGQSCPKSCSPRSSPGRTRCTPKHGSPLRRSDCSAPAWKRTSGSITTPATTPVRWDTRPAPSPERYSRPPAAPRRRTSSNGSSWRPNGSSHTTASPPPAAPTYSVSPTHPASRCLPQDDRYAPGRVAGDGGRRVRASGSEHLAASSTRIRST
ncbi:hypothetical protein BJ996_000039 [Streptomyces phaeogriseichromatogenes]|nr:hypothetical protein [Streptomyces murinus]